MPSPQWIFSTVEPHPSTRESLSLGGAKEGSLPRQPRLKRNVLPASRCAAVAEPKVSFPKLIGMDVYNRGLNSATATDLTMPWGATLSVGPDFFAEVENVAPLSGAESIS